MMLRLVEVTILNGDHDECVLADDSRDSRTPHAIERFECGISPAQQRLKQCSR